MPDCSDTYALLLRKKSDGMDSNTFSMYCPDILVWASRMLVPKMYLFT